MNLFITHPKKRLFFRLKKKVKEKRETSEKKGEMEESFKRNMEKEKKKI